MACHVHRCACGVAWICSKPFCHREAVCAGREERQLTDWMAANDYLTQAALEFEDAPDEAQERKR